MKPTIIYLLFALTLFIGVIQNKGFMKYAMGEAITMSDESWKEFSKRWSLFFFAMAATNEIIWRNFAENIWVNFKLFGILPLLLVFTLMQIPFLNKNKL